MNSSLGLFNMFCFKDCKSWNNSVSLTCCKLNFCRFIKWSTISQSILIYHHFIAAFVVYLCTPKYDRVTLCLVEQLIHPIAPFIAAFVTYLCTFKYDQIALFWTTSQFLFFPGPHMRGDTCNPISHIPSFCYHQSPISQLFLPQSPISHFFYP